MKEYLGELDIPINESKYASYTKEDWAMMYIEMYSGIDGAHHKDWLLDQVARILKGTPVELKVASWNGGHTEDRFSTGEPSIEYNDWALSMRGEYDPDYEEYEYDYDVGIAP